MIELQFSQARIESAFSHQGLMITFGDNLSIFHHHDALCMDNRRKPMGNDQSGAVLH